MAELTGSPACFYHLPSRKEFTFWRLGPEVQRIGADVASLARAAIAAEPEGVDFIHEPGDVWAVIEEQAGLEIPAVIAFSSQSGSGEIGGPDVGDGAIDDEDFRVEARAQAAFEQVAFSQGGMFVEVGAEPWAWFFGVEEAYGDAATDQFGEDGDERAERLAFGAALDEDVFEVGGSDPEEFFGGGEDIAQDARVVFGIQHEFGGWAGHWSVDRGGDDGVRWGSGRAAGFQVGVARCSWKNRSIKEKATRLRAGL